MTPILASLRNIWEKNWPEVKAAATGGLPKFIFARHPPELGLGVPVFCYHVIDARNFEADLDFLSRNDYVTIDADTLLDHLEKRRRAPRRAVVLTIDDGARNLYEIAFPLLQQYGMKSVAFIATRFQIEDPDDSLCASKSGLPSLLSWSEICKMHESGIIDFQSHTHEHRYIPRWPEAGDPEGLDPKITRSLRGPALSIAEDFRIAKEMLEQRLNKTVRHLAFPRFNGTRQALSIGKVLGYAAFWWGVLPHRSDNRPGHSPSYIVRCDGRYLRRLPGEGRIALGEIMVNKYRVLRLWKRSRAG